jgi:hypothetical protein
MEMHRHDAGIWLVADLVVAQDYLIFTGKILPMQLVLALLKGTPLQVLILWLKAESSTCIEQ